MFDGGAGQTQYRQRRVEVGDGAYHRPRLHGIVRGGVVQRPVWLHVAHPGSGRSREAVQSAQLVEHVRTKVFLATSDEFTARIAAELCGRADRLKARYTLAEGGQNAHISFLTGRATASKHSLSASKTYMLESDYLFQPRVFTELQHAQAIAVPYDGLNPLPPQYCYLKPHYLDVQTSYFDHVARGAL